MISVTQDRHFKYDHSGIFSTPGKSRRSKLYDENIERFRTLIEYLTQLRDNGNLTDKDYSTLITLACAKFVENEMSITINKVLGNSIEAALMSMESISRPFLSLLDSKINEKHIDKILEIKEKYGDRLFKDTQQSRRFQLTYVLIGVSVFIFLTLLLVGKDTELFKEIIKLFVAFAGGMGVGFGIKSHINNK